MLDLVRLQVLRAVADQGSLTAAANALRLTPSAVSQQMTKLEREAGCRLVERQGRRTRLTDEGRLLAEHAGRILGQVERAESALAERHGRVAGDLAVAAFPTAARGLLPAVLTRLCASHPELRPALRECEPYAAIPAVLRGEFDVAVCQDWANTPVAVTDHLSTVDIGWDPSDVVLPAGHPLAGRERITVDDLVDETWISSAVGTICHDWLLAVFQPTGRQPRVVHQAAEFPTQLALVAAGLGIALMPRLGRDRHPDGVRVVPFEPVMARRIFAVWRAGAARRPAVRVLVDALVSGFAA